MKLVGCVFHTLAVLHIEIAEEIGIEHGSDGGIAHLGVIEFRDIAINH